MRALKALAALLRAAFWITLIFAMDRPYLAWMTLIAIVWHEGAHILALCSLRCGARLGARLFGLRLSPEAPLSYRDERRVAAAGPIAGFVFAALCLLFYPLAPGYLLEFALCHLLTSLSNLLPIEGYDGYRILSCTLALHGRKDTPLFAVSFLFSAFFCLLSLSVLGMIGEGLWAAISFLFALICSIPNEENTIFENS